jgi:hypothetical protein
LLPSGKTESTRAEFLHRFGNDALTSDVHCAPDTAVNPLAAAALWIDPDEVRRGVLAVKVRTTLDP